MLEIRDMTRNDKYYVGTCTHINESEEIDRCSRIRNIWFSKMYKRGLRIKVALLDGKHAGFIYMLPIEISPWGPLGENLLFIPCLVSDVGNNGVGKALIDSAMEVTREQGKKGALTIAYLPDFFFMPGEFFDKYGFKVVKSRESKDDNLTEVLMLKTIDNSEVKVDFVKKNYKYKPEQGKIVIDLFWNTFCQTSVIEAIRVKKIAQEYGDKIYLKDHSIDDRDALLKHGIFRGIFVNGKEIFWGYEAPEEGIREAIERIKI